MLQSTNPLNGFYGTVWSEVAPQAWPVAMDLLQKESGAREEYARAFLDSRMGRTLADYVNGNINYSKNLSAAINLAIHRCNSWKLRRGEVSSAKIPASSNSIESVIKTKVWLAGHSMVADLYDETLEGMSTLFNSIRFKPCFEQLHWDRRHVDIIKQIDDMPQGYHGVLSAKLAPSVNPRNHLVLRFGMEQDCMIFRAAEERGGRVLHQLADEKIPLREWEDALGAFRRIAESIPMPATNEIKREISGPKKSPCPK